jgi:hypothetical protein
MKGFLPELFQIFHGSLQIPNQHNQALNREKTSAMGEAHFQNSIN